MKKLLVIILATAVMMSLSACAENAPIKDQTPLETVIFTGTQEKTYGEEVFEDDREEAQEDFGTLTEGPSEPVPFEEDTAPEPEIVAGNIPAEPETIIEYVTVEPETVIEYVATEPETVIQYVPVESDEPSGYLKDKVTETGILGEDYPIVSYYGRRYSPQGTISSNHKGIDFAMDEGTRLLAPCDCTVKYVGYTDERGYWVVMYWCNGYYIEYQHLSQIVVQKGQALSKGDVVAYSGDTGASLMPHLHLEVLESQNGRDDIRDFNNNSTRINPYYFIFGTDETYANQR